jgi:hypothetical protein
MAIKMTGNLFTRLLMPSGYARAGQMTSPVSVPDFADNVYHSLGLDPKAELRLQDDRPSLALATDEVIRELV